MFLRHVFPIDLDVSSSIVCVWRVTFGNTLQYKHRCIHSMRVIYKNYMFECSQNTTHQLFEFVCMYSKQRVPAHNKCPRQHSCRSFTTQHIRIISSVCNIISSLTTPQIYFR